MRRPPERLYEIAEKTVALALKRLPPELRDLAAALPVSLEGRPDEDLLDETDFDDDLLGLFVGDPCGETGESLNPMPAQILLFLENIWIACGEDEQAFRDEVRITYLHELGHYFGWDEIDLYERGLE